MVKKGIRRTNKIDFNRLKDLDKLYPGLRNEYCTRSLHKKDLLRDPLRQFAGWLDEAVRGGVQSPNAMTLATSNKEGLASARIVLLKGMDARGLVFFSNYRSQKGRELDQKPFAEAVFYWESLERQVRFRGTVRRLSRAESKQYFESRPREAQIAAWVSNQSEFILSRIDLEAKRVALTLKFRHKKIPLPPFWGGYRLRPERIEFWQGGGHRLNDRLCYVRKGTAWIIERLQP